MLRKASACCDADYRGVCQVCVRSRVSEALATVYVQWCRRGAARLGVAFAAAQYYVLCIRRSILQPASFSGARRRIKLVVYSQPAARSVAAPHIAAPRLAA